jgi:hypothetical protein
MQGISQVFSKALKTSSKSFERPLPRKNFIGPRDLTGSVQEVVPERNCCNRLATGVKAQHFPNVNVAKTLEWAGELL